MQNLIDHEARANRPPVHAAAEPVQEAVLRTLVYGDIFDFAMTREEIVRLCVAPGGSRQAIAEAIDALLRREAVECEAGFFCLSGRRDLVELRCRRAAVSARRLRQALRWGRVLWALPFVRLVAVTGSLAAGNADLDADIDMLVVVSPGRLWLMRVLTDRVRRLACRLGAPLCLNYLLTDGALAFEQRDLYTAHELAQMVPIAGSATAVALWRQNLWCLRFLPNAWPAPPLGTDGLVPPLVAMKHAAERVLGIRLVDRLEAWERRRKYRKLEAQLPAGHECAFGEDVYKYHLQPHGRRVMALYAARLASVTSNDRSYSA